MIRWTFSQTYYGTHSFVTDELWRALKWLRESIHDCPQIEARVKLNIKQNSYEPVVISYQGGAIRKRGTVTDCRNNPVVRENLTREEWQVINGFFANIDAA